MKKIISLFVVLFFGANSAWSAQLINGAGATFPYPLYSKWFSEYNKQKPEIQINYQSIGSGGGIRQLLDKTVDFGASDAPMTNDELSKSTVPVLHIPTVLGAVVLSYNVPGVTQSLKLSPEVLAGIYLGTITKWNDVKIQAENKGVQLSDSAISVVYRSDGSGTTYVFTDYLSKVSTEWTQKVGQGKSVKWPVGLGGKGNEGVAGLIKQTPGSIGYVELVYAKTNNFAVAMLKNKAGQYVNPTIESVTAAAQGALKTMPEDFRVSITNADGKGAYPISAFTYILVYQNMKKDTGKSLVGFLNWAVGPGQAYAKDLAYSPLPESLVKKVKAKISSIKLN